MDDMVCRFERRKQRHRGEGETQTSRTPNYADVEGKCELRNETEMNKGLSEVFLHLNGKFK